MNPLQPERRGKQVHEFLQKMTASLGFRLSVTCVLIAILGNALKLEKLLHTLEKFDASFGLAMFGVNIVLILVFAKRWQVIASGLDFEPPYPKLVRAVWLATFLGQFGPTLLIAETTRHQMLKRHATRAQLIISQILDRISGQIALFALVLLLSPVSIMRLDAASLNLLLVGSGTILFAVLIFHILGRPIDSLPHSDQAVELLRLTELPGHYGLSLIIQLLLVANFVLAAVGLGVRDQLWDLVIMVPSVFATIALLPMTVSDWGSRETAAAILLGSTGLETETIVSVSVVYGLFHLLAALPGALFFCAGRAARDRKSPKTGSSRI